MAERQYRLLLGRMMGAGNGTTASEPPANVYAHAIIEAGEGGTMVATEAGLIVAVEDVRL